MTIGSAVTPSCLRERIFGTVRRRIGCGVGLARLVPVSNSYLDIGGACSEPRGRRKARPRRRPGFEAEHTPTGQLKGAGLMAIVTGSDGITPREGWSSRTAFVLAAIGSAVGLGNLWRFPAEAGANGGGAFVLFYILCVVLIGLPVLLSETLIGRYGQSSAPESVRRMATESGASRHWDVLASIGVLSALLIVSFYCVVGGWVLYYIGVFAADVVQTGIGGGAFEGRDPAEIEGLLPGLFGNGPLMIGLDAAFLGVTLYFV